MEKPNSSKLSTLLQRRPARIAIGLIALILAYLFARWALDTGNLLDYLITLLLLVIGLRELVLGAVRGSKR